MMQYDTFSFILLTFVHAGSTALMIAVSKGKEWIARSILQYTRTFFISIVTYDGSAFFLFLCIQPRIREGNL